MKKLAVVVEVLQWILIVALLFVCLWMVTSCVSMVNIGKGDQEYDKPKSMTQSGTNLDSHDIDVGFRP